jgi:regulation of enolase protein 1 (concanavalin A-like superfamily)
MKILCGHMEFWAVNIVTSMYQLFSKIGVDYLDEKVWLLCSVSLTTMVALAMLSYVTISQLINTSFLSHNFCPPVKMRIEIHNLDKTIGKLLHAPRKTISYRT